MRKKRLFVILTVLSASLVADDWRIPNGTVHCFLDGNPSTSCTELRQGTRYHNKFDVAATCLRCTAPKNFQTNNIEAEVETTVGITRPCDYDVWSQYSGGVASASVAPHGVLMWAYAYLQQYTHAFPWSVTSYDAVDCDNVGGYILPMGPLLDCGIEWS